MNTKKIKAVFSSIGLPRIIIFVFLVALCIGTAALGLNFSSSFSDVLGRIGMNGIFVLAMVPAIKCGIGLNFGLALGIIGGILGALISIEFGLTGSSAFLLAMIIGAVLSSIIGALYGMLLNRVKGSEMTVSTYVGFSFVALMNIGWLVLPFKSPAMGWQLGTGLRTTISLESTFEKILSNLWSITTKSGVTIPVGEFAFILLGCLIVYLFFKSKLGSAVAAAGSNPEFAKAGGINVNKMRIIGTSMSMALAAIGIIVYAQSFGFIQLYNAPQYMSFPAVAAILIGGASINKVRISHVIIGVILFQGVITLGLPVANKLIPEGQLSEVLRLIISNGIIIYALSKAKGGK